jgi:hypothetical protein
VSRTDITPHRMIELLAIVEVCDNRFRKPGGEDVKAWVGFAEDGGWSVAAVGRIIRNHYRTPGAESIRPGDVEAAYREVRRKAMTSFEDPALPPGGLPAGVSYPEWLRAQQDAHKARVIARWAETGEDPRPLPPAPMGNRLPEILAAAPDEVRPALREAMTKTIRRKP